jgi:hypothetical protein
VLEVVHLYGDRIALTKLEFKRNKKHAERFRQLSIALYGEEAYWRRMQLAPIPSIFINGQLVFDVIPARDDLIKAIERFLGK